MCLDTAPHRLRRGGKGGEDASVALRCQAAPLFLATKRCVRWPRLHHGVLRTAGAARLGTRGPKGRGVRARRGERRREPCAKRPREVLVLRSFYPPPGGGGRV